MVIEDVSAHDVAKADLDFVLNETVDGFRKFALGFTNRFDAIQAIIWTKGRIQYGYDCAVDFRVRLQRALYLPSTTRQVVQALCELVEIRETLGWSKECRKNKENTMAYSEKVIDHYANPRNVGSMDKSDPNVGTGMVGAPECGDVMKLQVKVNPETGIIEDAKFKTFGCGSAIASSSLATEWLRGKTVDEALAIKNTDIVNELSLPPVKIHCSVLAEDAIKAAISDYKQKAAKA